jgi:hypothetical protein
MTFPGSMANGRAPSLTAAGVWTAFRTQFANIGQGAGVCAELRRLNGLLCE